MPNKTKKKAKPAPPQPGRVAQLNGVTQINVRRLSPAEVKSLGESFTKDAFDRGRKAASAKISKERAQWRAIQRRAAKILKGLKKGDASAIAPIIDVLNDIVAIEIRPDQIDG